MFIEILIFLQYFLLQFCMYVLYYLSSHIYSFSTTLKLFKIALIDNWWGVHRLNASNLDASMHIPSLQIFIFSVTYCKLQQLLLGLCTCSVQIILFDLERLLWRQKYSSINIRSENYDSYQIASLFSKKYIIFRFFYCPLEIPTSFLINFIYICQLRIFFTFR